MHIFDLRRSPTVHTGVIYGSGNMNSVSGHDTASLAEQISTAMLHNSGLFLRRAAIEIVGHGDDQDAAFDVDRATVVTVFTQVAVELAVTAMVLRNEGLPGVIVPRNLPATDADAEVAWHAGTLRTMSFENIKSKATKYLGDDMFWSIVDFLQLNRNKLVHFHTPLHEGDRFDLKYEAIDVLIQVIAALRGTDEYDFAHGSEAFLGKKLFKRILSFEPYRTRIEARAREVDIVPLKCPICSIRSYSREGEVCIGCGWSGELNLLKCMKCNERTVIFDNLNLPFNPSLKAACGNCDWEGLAYHCLDCSIDYLTDGHSVPECPWSEDHE